MLMLLAMTSGSVAAATRPPVMAGSFYPADPVRLRSDVSRYLEQAGQAGEEKPSVALVVPHAGYVYSGGVAAKAFASLDGERVRRVILLGPSHHRRFAGGALPGRNIKAFATPLGEIQLDIEALTVLRESVEFRGPAEAHGPEHSLEVELPFIQVAAPEARIVPILVGADCDFEDARRMALALEPLLDETTVVIASSDFTHYGERYNWTPFSEPELGAKLVQLGSVTADRIAAGDPKGFWHQIEVSGDTVCGARPLAVLTHLLAHAFNGSGEIREVTTSGHRSGNWDLSVTYAAITFSGSWQTWREAAIAPLGELTADQGAELVALARATLESRLLNNGSLAQFYAGANDKSARTAPAGAFVTLNNTGKRAQLKGRLRACMGVIEARQPLGDAIVQAAVWASRDPRFPPLEAAELDQIEIEVSALSAAFAVTGPEAIKVGTHGVILSKNGRRALFLPQVATEQGWDRETMLDHLARKAGLPKDGWRNGAEFEVFTAQVFGEKHGP